MFRFSKLFYYSKSHVEVNLQYSFIHSFTSLLQQMAKRIRCYNDIHILRLGQQVSK